MFDTPTSAAFATALILAVIGLFLWRTLVHSRREASALRLRVAHLERERMRRPSLRVSFEFNATTHEALLHVANDGSDATVLARMSVEGALSQPVNGDLLAVWQNETTPRVLIGHGHTRTLRLAQLDLSVFPYAQWEVYAAGDDQAIALRATHTSIIGGNPDTHAPTMFLQVAMVSSPVTAGPLAHSTIALQPFEAVRLQPV